ncbi:hypothetical protein SLEP1_g40608 [Rubroshorea leprosula]|uniref:Uncharacterized protein n=1 Tax=Rubroshorea leprosula TaxID=152421 RepID=A0AAV5L4T4_9ROSI|nr:hypothetical protein SLEP1_g40608 [Rubroshorea leprosula]
MYMRVLTDIGDLVKVGEPSLRSLKAVVLLSNADVIQLLSLQ